tara:strand:- start:376 stop:516 length:141 start_codon:yes stop_codon:yes gene_type:complete
LALAGSANSIEAVMHVTTRVLLVNMEIPLPSRLCAIADAIQIYEFN